MWRRRVGSVAAFVGLVAVALFLVVILTDLFPNLDRRIELPPLVKLVGPLAFQAGMLVLLLLLATTTPRQVGPLSPVLVPAAFVAIGLNLDLLPLAAVLVLLGLRTLGRPHVSEHPRHATGLGLSQGKEGGSRTSDQHPAA